MTSKDVVLLPCPHCGNQQSVEFNNHSDELEELDVFGWWRVLCSGNAAGCGSSSGYWETQEEAAQRWNARSSPDETTENERAALKAVLGYPGLPAVIYGIVRAGLIRAEEPSEHLGPIGHLRKLGWEYNAASDSLIRIGEPPPLDATTLLNGKPAIDRLGAWLIHEPQCAAVDGSAPAFENPCSCGLDEAIAAVQGPEAKCICSMGESRIDCPVCGEGASKKQLEASDVVPWSQLQKRAARGEVDIDVYVASMNAHILSQRRELARVHKQVKNLKQFHDWAAPQCHDYAKNRQEIAHLKNELALERQTSAARNAVIGTLGQDIERLRKAVEFAEYLATAAEAFMEDVNNLDAAQIALEEDDDSVGHEDMSRQEAVEQMISARGDGWRALRNRAYEFRKRAERAKVAAPQADVLAQAVSTAIAVVGAHSGLTPENDQGNQS